MQTLLRALQLSLLTTYKSKFTQVRFGRVGSAYLYALSLTVFVVFYLLRMLKRPKLEQLCRAVPTSGRSAVGEHKLAISEPRWSRAEGEVC